jgi:hypothetical protein
MRDKDRKWLQEIADLTRDPCGMYPGMTVDRLPASVAKRLGIFIQSYSPHNPIHKERWTCSREGFAALAEDKK